MDEREARAQLQSKVSALSEKFLERTRSQVTELAGLIEATGHGDTSVLSQLEKIAHKIHGSGAMFGFPSLSDAAGEIEKCAARLRDTGDNSALIETTPALHEACERLREAVEQAMTSMAERAPG